MRVPRPDACADTLLAWSSPTLALHSAIACLLCSERTVVTEGYLLPSGVT